MSGLSSLPPRDDGIQRFGGAIAASLEMARVFDTLLDRSQLASPVLLVGETGVGKQLLARALWIHGRSKSGPFIVLDGASSDVDSLERELGPQAFAFERACGGVLYVRNVEELPQTAQDGLQAALSRARTGNTEGARLIASSRRELHREVLAGRFSSGLFDALAEHTVVIPALRTRPTDVAPLVAHFFERMRLERMGAAPDTLPESLRTALAEHDWPGNVRELANVVERFVRNEGSSSLAPLSVRDHAPPRTAPPEPFDATRSFGDLRRECEAAFERTYVAWLLARHHGNLSRAAREARMDRKHLRDLARRHACLVNETANETEGETESDPAPKSDAARDDES